MRILILAILSSSPLSGQPPTTATFKNWDKNGDEKLAPNELPERLRSKFASVDRDGDGFITHAEQQEFLATRNSAKSNPEKPVSQIRIPESLEYQKNHDYVGSGNPRQMLDLILPKKRTDANPLPLIVFIHGGGWRNGSKDAPMRNLIPFVESGKYAGASINYRLTGESSWPTQIHDCKAAIRYLRGNAKKFGIDPDEIAVWGSSAGGHLVSMLGTSGGVKELDGNLGEFDEESSRVTCVVNFFGPQNFLTMVQQNSSIDRSKGNQYPEALLLGGQVQDIEWVAKQASPVTWVSSDDPPFLNMHGTEDLVVPYEQAVEIHAALKKAGAVSHLVPVVGGGHGFGGPEITERVETFLGKHLKSQTAEASNDPIKARTPGRKN